MSMTKNIEITTKQKKCKTVSRFWTKKNQAIIDSLYKIRTKS